MKSGRLNFPFFSKVGGWSSPPPPSPLLSIPSPALLPVRSLHFITFCATSFSFSQWRWRWRYFNIWGTLVRLPPKNKTKIFCPSLYKHCSGSESLARSYFEHLGQNSETCYFWYWSIGILLGVPCSRSEWFCRWNARWLEHPNWRYFDNKRGQVSKVV